MPRVHYLNVRNGACSIIQHYSDRVSVIDVNNGYIPARGKSIKMSAVANLSESLRPIPGNFDQKSFPDNPIEYLQKIGVTSVFRFIVSHPDMDHLDGIEAIFEMFKPANMWDTDNTKEFAEGSFGARKKLETDWKFYKSLRDTSPESNPKRLVYHSGDVNDFYKSDGLQILSPTPDLVAAANRRNSWNDSSYVILYKSCGKKILFTGDSEDETWEHILTEWEDEVSNIDILIAPHHGRDSDRNYDYLNVTKPKLTLFGNAESQHQSYKAFRNRGLRIHTNNQCGYIVLDVNQGHITVYAKHEMYAKRFAEANNFTTWRSDDVDGWFLERL